jgi:uncharacterized BrkB/YihY/UPF0761 family membrane protein
MAARDDADRDRWQTYWGAIRRGVWIVLVLGVVGFITGLLETAVREHGWRVALAAVITVVVIAAAKVVIDWLAARRQPGVQSAVNSTDE